MAENKLAPFDLDTLIHGIESKGSASMQENIQLMRYLLREELEPVLGRITTLEITVKLKIEQDKDQDLQKRIARLERQLAYLNGKIAAAAVASSTIVGMIVKWI